MVRLEDESLNTIDELIEVFEDWDAQLRNSNVIHFFNEDDPHETDDAASLTAAQHDCEPGGLS